MKNLINTRLPQTLRGIALAACLVGFVPAQGQVITANDYYTDYLYKAYSSTGQPQISVINTEDKANLTVQMYDENFNQIKEFSLIPSTYITRIVTEERPPISGEFVDVEIERRRRNAKNLEEVISEAQRYNLTSHTQEGNVHTFLPEPTQFEGDSLYSKIVYTEGNNFYIQYRIHHNQQYGEWQVTGERTEAAGVEPERYRIYNLDAEVPGGDIYSAFTQTLFNDDDKYEYFVPEYELDTEIYGVLNEERITINGREVPVKREIRYSPTQTGIKLVSEDGTVLGTFPVDYIQEVILMGGKVYVVTVETEDGIDKLCFYEINKQTTAIKKVHESEVKMFPRVARSSDRITIETSEADARTRREVVVTSMDGRTVERGTIPAGERSTQISAARLSGGVYNFTVYANGKRLDSGKIIVR